MLHTSRPSISILVFASILSGGCRLHGPPDRAGTSRQACDSVLTGVELCFDISRQNKVLGPDASEEDVDRVCAAVTAAVTSDAREKTSSDVVEMLGATCILGCQLAALRLSWDAAADLVEQNVCEST